MTDSIFCISELDESESAVEVVQSLWNERFIVNWHDHSTISGHSHYLIAVYFQYDPITYLTQSETR